MKPRERLREIRRGEPERIELITESGDVILLEAYGLTLDEKLRTRERALALLVDALRDAPVAASASQRDWAL